MRSIYCVLTILFAYSLCGCNSATKDDLAARKEFLRINASLAKAKTLSYVEVSNTGDEEGQTKEAILFLDTKHFRVSSEGYTTIADGDSVYTIDPNDKSYDRYSLTSDMQMSEIEGWGFPAAENSIFTERDTTYSFIKMDEEKILRRHMDAAGETVDVFYSLKTGLPLGYRHKFDGGLSDVVSYEGKYSKIVLNPTLRPDLFAFSAPAGYQFKSDRLESIKFANGGSFPSANLTFVDSRYRRIEQMALENKALLVIFWSHG